MFVYMCINVLNLHLCISMNLLCLTFDYQLHFDLKFSPYNAWSV